MEYPSDEGEPYYPVVNQKNKELYEQYQKLAFSEEKNNVYFVGRLANYKYFNMDEAIMNALSLLEMIN
jgi:UDP-galactopyranose mutase